MRSNKTDPNFGPQMFRDDITQTGIQLITVFMQNHRVSIAVQLFEAQTRIVLLLNLLNGAAQQIPDLLHELFVHCHLFKKINANGFQFHLSYVKCELFALYRLSVAWLTLRWLTSHTF